MNSNIILLLEKIDGLYGTSEFILKLRQVSKMDNSRVSDLAKHIADYLQWNYRVSGKRIDKNFFDISPSEDMISFIQNNRVPDDFLDNEIDPFSMPGRNETTIGKIIKRFSNLLDYSITDKQLEDFVNKFKSTHNTEFQFKLVNGSDIAKYYKSKNNVDGSGSLGSSCMVDCGESLFKIYTENKDVVSLLIFTDGVGKIHGRALVWKLEKSISGAQFFMDRIYTTRNSDINRFISYANERGWLYKSIMSSYKEDAVYFKKSGSVVHGEISVKLDGSFRKYPYFDTLMFLDKEKNRISNLPKRGSFILQDIDDHKRHKCVECDGKLKIDDEICDSCCVGHIELHERGIDTDVYKKIVGESTE